LISVGARASLGDDKEAPVRVRGTVLAGVVVAAAVVSPVAVGATAEVLPFPDDDVVAYQAAPGETNVVEQTSSAGVVTFHDSVAVITAGVGCAQIDPNEVQCSVAVLEDVLIFLGDGDDTAVVHSEPVSVSGDGGNDELTALCPGPRCRASGKSGDDIITGFSLAIGRGGNDTMTGSDRPDELFGSSGDDTIDGGGGPDQIFPGFGNDTVDGGEGPDIVVFDSAGFPTPSGRVGVIVNLRTGVATTGSQQDTLVGVERVRGTTRDDRLIGNAEDNTLFGERGADVLIGGGGNDLLEGSISNFLQPNRDRLYGGRGRDRLDGDAGGDLLVGGAGRDNLDGEEGADTIRARDGTRDIVRGGPQLDRARVDGRDDVEGIEIFF
jgi:Ca2+-binding RTX toxin-like protein